MTALERYEAALAGQPVDHLPCHPLTMLFASRLLGVRFHDYIMNWRLLAEGQLKVVETFGIDFVSTISDPCREVHDLGGHCTYFPDEAPANDRRYALLADKTRLAGLQLPDPLGGGRMHDRVKAIARLRERVGPGMSVQGWVEGPIALAVDLRGMEEVMLDILDDPAFLQDLFAFAVDLELAFARAQVEAGADTIGVGDAAASLVNGRTYAEQILPHARRLVEGIHALGAKVRLHVCGRTTHLVEHFHQLGCELVDIDYLCDLATARRAMPKTAILGNLEPARYLLHGTPDEIHAELERCRSICGPRFVVGAGCEIPKHSPAENVRAMVEFARTHTN